MSLQNRRWSPAQAREFLHLHSTLALITLHTDLNSQRTQGGTLESNPQACSADVFVWSSSNSWCIDFSRVAPGVFKLRLSGVPSSTPLLPLHADILASLFTPEGQPYLLEVTSKDTTRMPDFSQSYHKEYKTRQSFILSHGLFIRAALTHVLSLSLWISTRWCLPCVSCQVLCLSW